jgi:hypothetical protein
MSPPQICVNKTNAAKALGVSLSHFERHIQPELNVVLSGQLRLYPVSELERWVAEHATRDGRAA